MQNCFTQFLIRTAILLRHFVIKKEIGSYSRGTSPNLSGGGHVL